MVTLMQPHRVHKHPLTMARTICLSLMVALLANPVLAIVLPSMDCDSQCCCCTETGRTTTPTISGNIDRKSVCCEPTGSHPCHMSAGTLPDAPPALIQTMHETPVDPIHLLMRGSNAAACAQAGHLSTSAIDHGPEFPCPPLYLKTCRLIC